MLIILWNLSYFISSQIIFISYIYWLTLDSTLRSLLFRSFFIIDNPLKNFLNFYFFKFFFPLSLAISLIHHVIVNVSVYYHRSSSLNLPLSSCLLLISVSQLVIIVVNHRSSYCNSAYNSLDTILRWWRRREEK